MIERYRDGVVPDAEPDPELAGGEDGLAGSRRGSPSSSTDAELTQALEEIWVRVRRLNRYVEETRPWDLAKDAGQADRLDAGPLQPRRGPARRWPAAVRVHARDVGPDADGARRGGARLAAFGSRGGGQATEKLSPLFPKIETAVAPERARASPPSARAPRLAAVVDTHAHLSVCETDAADLVEAARRSGSGASSPWAWTRPPTARRSRRPRRTRRCSPASDATRTPPRASTAARRPRSSRWPRTSAWWRSVRPASTTTATAPRATSSERAFEAQIAIGRRTGLPLVIHMRDPAGGEEALSDTFATLAAEAEGVTVILHCCSAPPARVGEAAERGWYCSFAGNVTYPKADALRETARLVPEELLLVETDSPFLAPQSVRGKPNQPANVVEVAERLAAERGIGTRSSSESSRRTRPGSSNGDG